MPADPAPQSVRPLDYADARSPAGASALLNLLAWVLIVYGGWTPVVLAGQAYYFICSMKLPTVDAWNVLWPMIFDLANGLSLGLAGLFLLRRHRVATMFLIVAAIITFAGVVYTNLLVSLLAGNGLAGSENQVERLASMWLYHSRSLIFPVALILLARSRFVRESLQH
jgi:hypothetical protein